MQKRLISLIICFILIIYTAYADTPNTNMIINGSFEDNSVSWDGIIRSNVEHYSGQYSAKIMNPIGPSISEGVPHTAEYNSNFYLEEGSLYQLSLYVKSTTESSSNPPNSRLYYSTATNRVVFNISRVSSEWQYVSGLFVAGKNGEYSLSMILFGSSEATEFYVDDITLTPMPYKPVSITIQGRKNVYIPSYGLEKYIYRTITTDKNGNEIPVLTSNIYISGNLPEGITFSADESALIVSSTAAIGATVNLTCDPPAQGLKKATLNVSANKNLITNGSFDDYPLYLGWNNEDSDFNILTDTSGQNYAEIYTKYIDDNSYLGTLTMNNTLTLKGGVLYVFRAKVKSSAGFDSRRILTNASLNDGQLVVYISNIGGEDYSDIFAAVRPNADGIFQLSFNFLVSDDRPIYIDDIKISEESVAPADIIFNAPAHISKPSSGSVSIPIDYAVRDQEGNIMPFDSIKATILPSDAGITVNGKNIIVSSNAKEKNYKITAVYNDDLNVCSNHTFSVTSDTVGDGSFEYQSPGQWWNTGNPSKLNIISTYAGHYPTDGGKMARLAMNGSVSILISDSYKKYEAGKSYVFEASLVKVVPDVTTIATVLIDNVLSESFDDNLILNQFEIKNDDLATKIVFTPTQTITGNLMIAFNTPEEHDSQIILIDNIKIPDALSEAKNVYISGLPYSDKNITGKYKFTANFDTADISTFRWLMSATIDGVYMPITGQTSQTLSVTSDMVDMYIKFEVTPISLVGAVMGKSVISTPVKIGVYSSGSSEVEETPIEVETPGDENNQPNNPADGGSGNDGKPKRELQVIDLHNIKISSITTSFVDMNNHWALNDVSLMTAAGIVNGRGDGLFAPSETITRAEFSAFLIRAFRLAPLYYTEKFQDVNSWDWYSGVVETVSKYGIALGTSDNVFSPNLPLTREQMVVMLMRAYNKSAAIIPKDQSLNYTDAYNISSWATQDIGLASYLGIINGTLTGSFEPKRNATRAEAIVAIKRMIYSVLGT